MDSIRFYPNINGIREQQKLRFLPFTKLLEKSVRSYYDGNVGVFPRRYRGIHLRGNDYFRINKRKRELIYYGKIKAEIVFRYENLHKGAVR